MADLALLRELHEWMRSERILYARCGDLELRLEPVAPAPPAVMVEAPLSAEDAERRSLEELLYSSGIDPEPFLALRRSAA